MRLIDACPAADRTPIRIKAAAEDPSNAAPADFLPGLLADAAIGRLEGSSSAGLRSFVRPTIVAAFTAFYVNR